MLKKETENQKTRLLQQLAIDYQDASCDKELKKEVAQWEEEMLEDGLDNE